MAYKNSSLICGFGNSMMYDTIVVIDFNMTSANIRIPTIWV